MIHFLYAEHLGQHPKLRDGMFRDRAEQFKTRLNWDVTVTASGHEIDQYDGLNPLYAIWENADGGHGGSMRFLPTIGQTMVNDHFSEIIGGVRIESALIWESTRFCISPSASEAAGEIAAALMIAGCEIGLQFGLSDWVGVFDPRMVRIYRRIGWEPTLLGEKGQGRDRIGVGLWAISDAAQSRMCRAAGMTRDRPKAWFDAAFPHSDPARAA